MFNLDGKHALVTGASGGIGAAIARALHDRGAVVALSGRNQEALAGLAMLLLRDFGIMTVHFAGLPPGTSAMLIKFMPPETLDRFGGPEKFADAVNQCLDRLADIIASPAAMRELLYGPEAD